MPRPQRAQGRPGTAVISPGWEAGHRPVVAATHTCPVQLFHPADDPGADSWDTDSEQVTVGASAAYWTGLARIQALRDLGGTSETAGDQVAVVTYQVTLTAAEDIAAAAGDVVRIDPTYGDDPLLAGKAIHVAQVVRGSLRFERLLYGQLVDNAPG